MGKGRRKAVEIHTANLQTEYNQVNSNFRALAEIRFKLLAFIPSFGGVAIFLLTSLEKNVTNDPVAYGMILLISILGFLATLGVTFYDQRNSQLYNALGSRAKFLEKLLDLPRNPLAQAGKKGGQFNERPNRNRKFLFIITMWHDLALALIYGAVLGAWLYPISNCILGIIFRTFNNRYLISLIVSLISCIVFFLELLRLDGTFKKRKK